MAFGSPRAHYTLGERVITQRDGSGAAVYLHGDHLGSVSAATGADGRVLSRQDFDPWGQVRGGDIPQTTRDLTGQRRDGTDLLFLQRAPLRPGGGAKEQANSPPGTGDARRAGNVPGPPRYVR